MWRRATSCWPGKGVLRLLFLMTGMAVPSYGQVAQENFQADPANLYEWRALMANPSIGAFQTGAFEAGVKIFHLGFADAGASLFKTAYGLVNLPRMLPGKFAFGFRSQMFNTPIYRETELHFNVSRRFFGAVSLGLSAGLRNISYRTENFNLVDANDPVFAGGGSRWTTDLGAGVTIIPMPAVVVGIGARHLNEPPVTLSGNDITLEPAITASVSFNFGSLALNSGSRERENKFLPRGYAQVYDPQVGMLQLGYTQDLAWLRGRLHVAGPLSIGYGFSLATGELQGTSNGTHEATVVWEFDRLRGLPRQGIPPSHWTPFQPEMARIGIVPQYAVLGSEEAVDIFTKVLIREISPDVDRAALGKLTEFDLGILDTSFVEKVIPFELQKVEPIDSTAEFTGQYSSGYRASLSRLRADLVNKEVEALIVAPETQIQRAMALGNYLRQALNARNARLSVNKPDPLSYAASVSLSGNIQLQHIQPTDTLTLLNPGQIVFTIHPIAQKNGPQEWTLVVENAKGRHVYEHTQQADTLTHVAWNWRDHEGRVIAPGFYRYYVAWEAQGGQIFHSPARKIYARELRRRIHLKITRRYEKTPEGANKIGVILNR